jgi:hypothetical protein
MPPEVVGADLDSHQSSRFLHHGSGSRIRNRKNASARFDTLLSNILLEPIRDLLWNENNLCILSALGIKQDQLPILNVFGFEFEHLPDRIAPLAISSKISRSLGFTVLKMISSTTSFSRIFQ